MTGKFGNDDIQSGLIMVRIDLILEALEGGGVYVDRQVPRCPFATVQSSRTDRFEEVLSVSELPEHMLNM